MGKKKSYKTFKQVLNKASLPPLEDDWEKMQAMLDKQLPLPGGKGGKAKPLAGLRTWLLAGFIVVTGVTAFLLVKKNSSTGSLSTLDTTTVAARADGQNTNAASRANGNTADDANAKAGLQDSAAKSINDSAVNTINNIAGKNDLKIASNSNAANISQSNSVFDKADNKSDTDKENRVYQSGNTIKSHYKVKHTTQLPENMVEDKAVKKSEGKRKDTAVYDVENKLITAHLSNSQNKQKKNANITRPAKGQKEKITGVHFTNKQLEIANKSKKQKQAIIANLQNGIAKNDKNNNDDNVEGDNTTGQQQVIALAEAGLAKSEAATAEDTQQNNNKKPADIIATKDAATLTRHETVVSLPDTTSITPAKKDWLAKSKTDDKKNKQSNSSKTKNGKSAPGPTLLYGLQLSPLQLNVGTENKVDVNYVPGLFGQYYFHGRLGIGLSILPYYKQSVGSDSLYATSSTAIAVDSAAPVITTTKTAYYANSFTSYKGAVSLTYKFSNHFTLETGAGLQHITNGKVSRSTTVLRDSVVQSVASNTVRLTSADTAFQNIRKNTGFLFLNVWYTIKQWQFGMVYNQPLGNWLKTGNSKSKPQVLINLRYNLNFSKKRH